MKPSHLRIEVCLSASPEWQWTAWLTEWDGTEWRYRAAEDGDTEQEAIDELHTSERLSRGVPIVHV